MTYINPPKEKLDNIFPIKAEITTPILLLLNKLINCDATNNKSKILPVLARGSRQYFIISVSFLNFLETKPYTKPETTNSKDIINVKPSWKYEFDPKICLKYVSSVLSSNNPDNGNPGITE